MAFSFTSRSIAALFLVLALNFGLTGAGFAQAPAAPTLTAPPAPAAPAQAEPVAPAKPEEAIAHTPTASILEKQRPIIDGLKQQSKQLNEQLQKSLSNDEALSNLKLKLDELSKKLLDAGVAFRPRLTEINTRLEQLGAAPTGDQKEPQIVADERRRLTEEKAQINAILGETEDTSLNVNQMAAKISDLRRELFARTLSQRVDLNYTLGSEVVDAAGNQVTALARVVQSWWRFVINFKLKSFIAAAFFALVAALIIQFGARHMLGTLYRRDPSIEEPSYLSRLLVAFWSTVIPSAAVAVFLGTTYFFLNYFNVLRSDIATILDSLFIVLGLVYFIHRLAWAILSPDMPAWRLIKIAPRPGRVLAWLISATAFASGVDSLIGTINGILMSPLSLTMAKSFFSTVMIGILILTMAFLKPVEDSETGNRRRWPRPFRFFLIALGLVPILAAFLGYIGLARFVSQQIVVTGAFLVTMYLGFLTARAISEEKAFAQSKIGHAMEERFHLGETALDQLGLLAGILINLVVAGVGIPLVLVQLGFQWNEIRTGFYRLFTGFQIGNITISLMGILTAVVVFILAYLFTRWFQKWLDTTVMARGKVDSGVRNSIKTVVGYIGLVFAGLLALSSAGFNMSNLALVAGGLSLGIGFGLQNIVQNFVSGLILLAERPFKAGDWVEAGGISGIVKKISVRATEVETFQKQSIIVPNSTLINGNVANWTHRNKLGRIDINVMAAYHEAEDVRRIHQTLLEIAKAQPTILKNPEPFVALQSMTESSVEFILYGHVADITATGGIKNELRMQIIERFREEGLHLASSSTSLVLSAPDLDEMVKAAQMDEEVAQKKAKEKAPRTKPQAAPEPDDKV